MANPARRAEPPARRYRIAKPLELLKMNGLQGGHIQESHVIRRDMEPMYETEFVIATKDGKDDLEHLGTLTIPQSTIDAYPEIFEEIK